jgi:hypothetical protein
MLRLLVTDDDNATIKRTEKRLGKMTDIFEICCFKGSARLGELRTKGTQRGRRNMKIA